MPPHDMAHPANPADLALWEEFAAPLRAFVRRRVPETIDPNDVVQDTFLRILRHLPDLEEVERLDAWIFQVARTAIADALRAHGRRQARTVSVDTDTLELPAEESPAALAELTPCLAPFVRRLDEPYRSALELTALGGLTQQQAAEQAGISLSGMKSRVQRARAQVRQLMGVCCALEFDTRGSIMDYEVRDPSACAPAPISITRRSAT